MAGSAKSTWTPEQLEKIKALMFEAKSMREIGEALGSSRSSVISAIHRNPDFFQNVPRNGNGSRSAGRGKSAYQKPGEQRAKEEAARRKSKAITEHQIESAEALKDMRLIQGRPDEIRDPWKAIQKGDKIFVYHGMALDPTYIFTRPYAGGNWRGHGIHADTKGRIFAWCNMQRPAK